MRHLRGNMCLVLVLRAPVAIDLGVSVAGKHSVDDLELRHLDRAAGAVVEVGVSEVDDKGSAAGHEYVGVRASEVVVLSRAVLGEDVGFLTDEMLAVIGRIYRLTRPDVRDQPIFAFKFKDVRTLLTLIGGCDALVFPFVKVVAVGIAGCGVLLFVLVPHTPFAAREAEAAGVDDPRR